MLMKKFLLKIPVQSCTKLPSLGEKSHLELNEGNYSILNTDSTAGYKFTNITVQGPDFRNFVRIA